MNGAAVVNETPTESSSTADLNAGEVQRFISRPHFGIRHTVTTNCEFQPHSHTAFTVVVVLGGQMSAIIEERSFDLTKGAVALIDVGQTHSAQSSAVEFLSIGISPVLVNELVTEIGVIRASAEIVFRANVTHDETIEQLLNQVIAEISAHQIGHAAMLDTLVRQLAIHLLRCHLTVRKSEKIELSRAGPVDRRLRRAIEFMHDNFADEIALDEIAAAAYLSEYHFARLFKQICGITPHVYLANLRLDRARKLLAETTLPISEIASAVGYQSQSHFTKIFKSITGVTPRVYRESAK